MNGLVQYLTEKEVSVMTRRALSTLRNDRFHRRGLPYHKVGKSIRYKLADVVSFMDAGRIEPRSSQETSGLREEVRS